MPCATNEQTLNKLRCAMEVYFNDHEKYTRTAILLVPTKYNVLFFMPTGDMVVHLMLPALRKRYQLEKLWTLGPLYDDQFQELLKETLEAQGT